MAEGGFIKGLLESEAEESEAEATGLAAEPLAIAVAADNARFDPELSREATAYLRQQAHLVGVQTEHLHEQREVQLDHLKLRRVAERMRVALQAFLVVVGALIGAAFLWSVWSAINDHGLVVEPFSVPADLTARGLSGEVVAKQVLDRLSDLQEQTDSIRAADSYKTNWGDDLKVEIPETGVSVGEVNKYLRNALGHETHISGEVFHIPTGLTITSRAGEEASKSFSGPDADVESLIERVSEAIYGRTQPYRYAVYLRSHGRVPEARAVYEQLATSTRPLERAWAHLGLGFLAEMVGDMQVYASECRLALREVPDFAPALADLVVAEGALQHDEQQFIAAKQSLAAKSSLKTDVSDAWRGFLIDTSKIQVALSSNDLAALTAPAQSILNHNVGAKRSSGTEFLFEQSVLDHDYDAAHRMLNDVSPDERPSLAAMAAVLGHAPQAVDQMRTALAISQAQPTQNVFAERTLKPFLTLALAQAGDLREAQATIVITPVDCDLCVRVRGTIASIGKDRLNTEKWFRLAIQRVPALSQGYIERGQARFRLGDLDGALADARMTVRLSPRFADGYALWGDVLAKERRWGEARRRYSDALRYAPHWAAARRALDEVSARS